jgi:hypothetical protein
MKPSVVYKLTIISGLFLAMSVLTYGQNVNVDKDPSSPKASLIDSFRWSGGDGANARLDNFMINIQNDPKSRGYFIIYCGKSCFYGEIEAHFTGIRQALARRKFELDSISLVFGGFREETTTEFWLVPDYACRPAATPTLGTDKIIFVRSRKKVDRPYWCC